MLSVICVAHAQSRSTPGGAKREVAALNTLTLETVGHGRAEHVTRIMGYELFIKSLRIP